MPVKVRASDASILAWTRRRNHPIWTEEGPHWRNHQHGQEESCFSIKNKAAHQLQLRLDPAEQVELDAARDQVSGDPEFRRIWWQERLRAARRVFNDPEQVEKIVELLEAASGHG